MHPQRTPSNKAEGKPELDWHHIGISNIYILHFGVPLRLVNRHLPGDCSDDFDMFINEKKSFLSLLKEINLQSMKRIFMVKSDLLYVLNIAALYGFLVWIEENSEWQTTVQNHGTSGCGCTHVLGQLVCCAISLTSILTVRCERLLCPLFCIAIYMTHVLSLVTDWVE